MSRPIEKYDPNEVLAIWKDKATKPADGGGQTYACKLVTPLYGGGVRAGEVDRDMPIRAASIRGQLRFWWRVACGPFTSPEAMFAREAAIWGGIATSGPTASQVAVKVVCKPVTDMRLVGSDAEIDAGVRYAFGPATINGVAQWLRPGYGFDLALRYPPSLAPDVDLALRWWGSFGGIGARTRRGFGALRIEGIDEVSQTEVASAGARLAFSGGGSSNPEAEWKRAIGRLFAFRQKGGTGRRAGTPRPGRSFWPEADQLRRFTGRDANGQHAPVHQAGNVFPRAAFGLPILFEFKGSPGEPPKSELLPAGGQDRMASPVILRPYWNGQRWQAAALLLPWWSEALLMPLRFKSGDYQPASWPLEPEARRTMATAIPPMQTKGQLRAEDPLSAFLHFFAEA